MADVQHRLPGSRNSGLGLQAIADEAKGENVLIVTHGDGVNASVTRIWPWAIAHPVLHTGYTVAMREREEGVQLLSTSGMNWLSLVVSSALAVLSSSNELTRHDVFQSIPVELGSHACTLSNHAPK